MAQRVTSSEEFISPPKKRIYSDYAEMKRNNLQLSIDTHKTYLKIFKKKPFLRSNTLNWAYYMTCHLLTEDSPIIQIWESKDRSRPITLEEYRNALGMNLDAFDRLLKIFLDKGIIVLLRVGTAFEIMMNPHYAWNGQFVPVPFLKLFDELVYRLENVYPAGTPIQRRVQRITQINSELCRTLDNRRIPSVDGKYKKKIGLKKGVTSAKTKKEKKKK